MTKNEFIQIAEEIGVRVPEQLWSLVNEDIDKNDFLEIDDDFKLPVREALMYMRDKLPNIWGNQFHSKNVRSWCNLGGLDL
jgi:hypothetical protein